MTPRDGAPPARLQLETLRRAGPRASLGPRLNAEMLAAAQRLSCQILLSPERYPMSRHWPALIAGGATLAPCDFRLPDAVTVFEFAADGAAAERALALLDLGALLGAAYRQFFMAVRVDASGKCLSRVRVLDFRGAAGAPSVAELVEAIPKDDYAAPGLHVPAESPCPALFAMDLARAVGLSIALSCRNVRSLPCPGRASHRRAVADGRDLDCGWIVAAASGDRVWLHGAPALG